MSDSPRPQPAPAGKVVSAAHKFIHYGSREEAEAIVPTSLVAKPQVPTKAVAVLVCHGMGQQVRYQTISSVAEAVRSQVIEKGGTPFPVDVHLSEVNDDFLPRAELRWTDKDRQSHEVHVYEAYWAPLTEGKVSYWDTVKFLVRAAFKGLRWSKPLMRTTFKRWMFGDAYDMPIGRVAWVGLLVVLAFLLVQVGMIAYVSLALGQQWKVALSQPLPHVTGVWPWVAAFWHWLASLVPGIDFVREGRSWFWVALWFALLGEVLFVRYFIIEFVGDVAAYISPYKDSKFDDLRHQVRKIGMNVGKLIYGFGEKPASIPYYETVVIVGHSLGSVLAYDTLNSLIAADEVCSEDDKRNVVGRTRGLITFGSPLDKTAFIFRLQAKNDEQWTREKLAAAVQPLIVSYTDYRPATFTWVNIWSLMDIISGSLQYYDRPDVLETDANHVQNIPDYQAWVPFYAHVQYWGNKKLREQLYCFVAGTPCPKEQVAAAAQSSGG